MNYFRDFVTFLRAKEICLPNLCWEVIDLIVPKLDLLKLLEAVGS